MTKVAAWALAAGAALVLGGCYEDVTPTQYEPHEYKGAKDPLLGKLEGDDLQRQLEQRFQQAARDR